MRFSIPLGAALLAAAAATMAQAQPVKPDPAHIPFTLPKDIKWVIDKNFGEENAYLLGDPAKPGPYVMLIRWKPHQMSRPHYHNTARNIYVVSGTWWVSDSRHYDPDATYPLPAGSFATDMPGQIHWDGAKDEPVILELVGTGPANTIIVPEKK